LLWRRWQRCHRCLLLFLLVAKIKTTIVSSSFFFFFCCKEILFFSQHRTTLPSWGTDGTSSINFHSYNSIPACSNKTYSCKIEARELKVRI
jgi:hypothetical protein